MKFCLILLLIFSGFAFPVAVSAQVGSDMKNQTYKMVWLTIIRRQMDNPFMCLPLKNARTGTPTGILLECLTGGEPHQLLPDGKDIYFTVQDSITPKEVILLALDMLEPRDFWEVYKLYNGTDILSYEMLAYREQLPIAKVFREKIKQAEKIWDQMPFKPE
ncbi:hypothetical protein COW46_01740 [Candidatus Gracilibacteria bacterium CG17_big_fil_post_rev_8_21_14_2_50_48_13]|nr:MAG: hypothetical protein COW46_01740 [Candidatus Gracilibacteria bacterium CG17_big_fil_post_rev_8_21_14_2_50_48_13]